MDPGFAGLHRTLSFVLTSHADRAVADRRTTLFEGALKEIDTALAMAPEDEAFRRTRSYVVERWSARDPARADAEFLATLEEATRAISAQIPDDDTEEPSRSA